VRRIPWLGLLAIAMIVTGIVIAVTGHNTLRWAPPPAPPAWAARDTMPTGQTPASQSPAATPGYRTPSSPPSASPGRQPTAPASQAAAPAGRQPGAGLPSRSSPVSLAIPAIKVHASIIALGLNPNGTLIVPPLGRPRVTSWFDKGPIPGQPGAAAILGHVDASGVGPAVFYNLGNLRPGARIYITLRDGQTVVFATYSVALYSKAKFPTEKVFGFTSWPTLRLITCGGEFDQSTRHYDGNVVAFASYVGTFR
jgi:Sortase domain